MIARRTSAAMTALLFIASCVGSVAGCGPSVRNRPHITRRRPRQPLPSFPPIVDAPFELAHEMDRKQETARYVAMKLSNPKRAALRLRLANEYASRLKRAIKRKQPRNAYDELSRIAQLWTPQELYGKKVPDIARYAEHARLVRAELARAGDDKRALTALAILLVADPANAAKHRAEIDEVLKYGDALMMSLAGKAARRARPIKALQHVAQRWPTAFIVDKLIGLLKERQRVFARQFKRNHRVNFRMMRAHGMSVLHTTWHVVRWYARTGRLDEALAAIKPLAGSFGDDRDLATRLRRATQAGANPPDWVRLSKRFEGKADKKQKDLLAVRGILRAAIAKFSSSTLLRMRAGAAAEKLKEYALAVRHYRAAYRLEPTNRAAAAKLAALYNQQLDRLLFGSRPQAARKQLAVFEALQREASKRWPNKPLATDLAVAYATMGRGFAGLGELSSATSYLKRSIKARPTLVAYEMLVRIALKRGDYSDAATVMKHALTLPIKRASDKLTRAAILGFGATIYVALNQKTTALEYAFGAIDMWSKILEGYKLSFSTKAEIFIDWGKVAWTVGRKKQAIQLFETVVNGASKRHVNARIMSSLVSFLIVRGHYDLALDAYYRVLGSHKADPEQKVYMSLWVVTEARRTKREVDPLATAYLASRTGRLWYDDLARLASGRANLKTLSSRATSRARRAELLYYAAMLKSEVAGAHEIESMMRGVLTTQVVLFFEYDMAKLWLDRRIGRVSPKR